MKNKLEAKQKGKIQDTKKRGIIISETEDDVILGGIKGDPDDFKAEVKKEAEKGKFLRTITPILVFLLLGALVACGTMYYKKQSETQTPKKTEDKIQTPPTVSDETKTDPTPNPDPAPTTPTTPTPTPTTPAAPTTGATEYTVVAGDTLSGIANAHGMTSADLAKFNNISVDAMLQIGQKLNIPKSN